MRFERVEPHEQARVESLASIGASMGVVRRPCGSCPIASGGSRLQAAITSSSANARTATTLPSPLRAVGKYGRLLHVLIQRLVDMISRGPPRLAQHDTSCVAALAFLPCCDLSYRNDLDAAQARAEAAERRAADLERKLVAERTARLEAERHVVELAGQPAQLGARIPARLSVEVDADVVIVSWRWFRAICHLPVILLCIVLDTRQVLRLAGSDTLSAVIDLSTFLGNSWMAYVGVGVFLASMLLLHYVALTGLFNRTSVRGGLGRLTVQNGPIPSPGNRELSSEQLRQLHVTERRTEVDNPKTTHYDLCALLVDGREVTLLQGLEELEQARYLEGLFEQHLGILEPRPESAVP